MTGLPLLVGRDRDLERASAVLDGSPQGDFVLIEGEAGIGKTRLVREVVGLCEKNGGTVVFGAAEDGDGAAVPFSLWRGPLRRLGRRLPAATTGEPLDERRWEVWEVLEAALAEADRALVVLEDLHWADEDSLWVLRQLVGPMGRTPTLVTSRPVGSTTSRRWLDVRRDATVVALEPLREADVAELMRDAGRDDAEAGQLCERAGGNPLLVHELLTGRSGKGSVVLGEHLRRILDDAGADVAATVRLLALGGTTTPVAVVADARGVPANQVVAEIARAVQLDILRSGDEQVSFRHALLSETLVDHLDARSRLDLHSRLARAWSAQGDELTARLAAMRHHLAAGAAADDEPAILDILETALSVADDALRVGRAGEASTLCEAASALADDLAPGRIDLRSRILVTAAEAGFELSDLDHATDLGVRAVALADEGAPLRTRARAAVVALRHHNPFDPDPVSLNRLQRLAGELESDGVENPGSAPDPLLVEVLGRCAVLGVSISDPTDEPQINSVAERALDLARRNGDPALIIGALSDRYFAPATPGDLDARGSAGVEVVALARGAGRLDLAMTGQEWIFGHHVTHGDLVAAESALDELAVLARLVSSPYFRYTELVRRSLLSLLAGRFDEAVALTDEARRLGEGFVPRLEAVGIHIGYMTAHWLVTGIGDPRIEPTFTEVFSMLDLPVAFLQVQKAVALLYLDRPDDAARVVAPWLARPAAVLAGPEGLGALVRLAETVWRLGLSGGAAVSELLAPFAGRTAFRAGASLPVDLHIGWLALVEGDVAAAVASATSGRAAARRMPSPPIEAHALFLLSAAQEKAGDPVSARAAGDAAAAMAERLGMTLPHLRWLRDETHDDGARQTVGGSPSTDRGSSTPVGGRSATLERTGSGWSVRSLYGDGTVADSVGMSQLAALVMRPGSEFAAAELAGGGEPDAPPAANDLGAVLDARAKREYRARIAELQIQIDDADRYEDQGGSERAHAEMETLLHELRRAVGLGGRDRPQGSGNERARVNVTRNVRRAIRSIEAAVPLLGAHLTVSVRTGHRCCYAPEPSAALEWTVLR